MAKAFSDRHGDREVQVFRAFAERCRVKFDLSTLEKRNPPEPDVVCRTLAGESIAFELVEVIDSDLAQGVYGKLRLQERFAEAYQALPREQQQQIASHVGDALVNVCFCRDLGFARRLSLIPKVLDEVKKIPPGSTEDHAPQPGSPLFGYVRNLMVSRGSYVGPIFDVEAFVWFSDPVVDRLESKFRKKYTTDLPMELLVYYETQPNIGRVERSDVAAYVKQKARDSPYRRVWVHEMFGDKEPIPISIERDTERLKGANEPL